MTALGTTGRTTTGAGAAGVAARRVEPRLADERVAALAPRGRELAPEPEGRPFDGSSTVGSFFVSCAPQTGTPPRNGAARKKGGLHG